MFYYTDGLHEVWKDNAEAAFLVSPNIRDFGGVVFENCRTYGDQIFALELHLDRLFTSAKILNISISFSREEIQNKILECFEKSKEKSVDLTIRIFLSEKFFAIGTEPLALPDPQIYESGVEVCEAIFERNFPQAKYPSPAYAVFEKSKPAGIFETIFFTEAGFLREGNVSNVFVVFSDTSSPAQSGKYRLCTPGKNILKGVTRDRVLRIAQSLGMIVEEREISREEILESATEIFLTNTSKEIVPVRQWEGWTGGNFEISSVLRAKFRAAL